MTAWNHSRYGRVEGTIEQVSEGARWTYIRLTRALLVNGQEVQVGATHAFLTAELDEDRTGRPAPTLSPDCRDGNHQKCDGIAWDMLRDEPTDCGCSCHA